MHYASMAGRADCVERLLANGAMSTFDTDGHTPVMKVNAWFEFGHAKNDLRGKKMF